jgi:hypothetical protein
MKSSVGNKALKCGIVALVLFTLVFLDMKLLSNYRMQAQNRQENSKTTASNITCEIKQNYNF